MEKAVHQKMNGLFHYVFAAYSADTARRRFISPLIPGSAK